MLIFSSSLAAPLKAASCRIDGWWRAPSAPATPNDSAFFESESLLHWLKDKVDPYLAQFYINISAPLDECYYGACCVCCTDSGKLPAYDASEWRAPSFSFS